MMQKPSFNGRREPYFMREIIVPPANYKPVDTKMRLSLSILENEQHHETEDWEEQERWVQRYQYLYLYCLQECILPETF